MPPADLMPPRVAARVAAAFADAILPGDDVFPAASEVGAHGVMIARLRERQGADAPTRLMAALLERGGLDDAVAAATRLEADEPRLFDTARAFLTFAYYESPAVIAAIRSLGHIYNDAPQPDGYALRPFEPARDAPATPRGGYVATDAVTRVDLSGLDFLGGRS